MHSWVHDVLCFVGHFELEQWHDATAIARSYPTQIHLFPGISEASLDMFSS